MIAKHSDAVNDLPNRSPVWGKLLVGAGILLLLALPILLGVWLEQSSRSFSGSTSSDTTGSEASVETASRIEFMQKGTPIQLHNGSTVDLGDGLKVQVFVSPYPPDQLNATLDLFVIDNANKPVTDAKVNLDYNMLYMSHGQNEPSIINLTDGHYLANLDFEMFGLWALDTKISVPRQKAPMSLPLVLYVRP